MDSGILTGPAIVQAIKREEIKISPFHLENDVKRINPNSIDLTLGNGIAVYSNCTNSNFDCMDFNPEVGVSGIPGERLESLPFKTYDSSSQLFGQKLSCYLDSAKQNPVAKFTMDDRGFLLKPGIGYLMHTNEQVWSSKYIPVIDGKSSIGRLFCVVHETAGYGDIGFSGQYTLEVVVIHPLVIYPNMRICQIRFHTSVGDIVDYKDKGNYVGEASMGAVPSKSWKMFSK